ncbi:hypothetical protein VR7878_01793 [Vibrio ruber DSM 16370]|uniref:Uncharacterized protein n=1 Tax=Vibrio ruber (strain DSM 16370 / JCM 11486 / BCRC 17186 / CECT 7878 / LMG 23124 / VR1) TaxID=1123498 RepID=A0A1R4LIY2_VIBR1|nr:hypothetical protein VR7878_01793 [Vibrio ruber DSM 16370]
MKEAGVCRLLFYREYFSQYIGRAGEEIYIQKSLIA